jgi:hypothetical protein
MWQVLDRYRILVLIDGGHVNSCDLSRAAMAFLRLLRTGFGRCGLVFKVVCFLFFYYCALLSATAFSRSKLLNFWTRISLASTFSTSGSHNNWVVDVLNVEYSLLNERSLPAKLYGIPGLLMWLSDKKIQKNLQGKQITHLFVLPKVLPCI